MGETLEFAGPVTHSWDPPKPDAARPKAGPRRKAVRSNMVAKNKDEGSAEWDQIEIGDQVKHPKWGVGTVLFRSGMGNNAKAIVVFPEEGQIKLMLKYAKMKKVGTTSLKSVEKMKAESMPKPLPVEKILDEEEVDLELEGDLGDEGLLLDEEDSEVVGFGDDEEDEFGPSGASEDQ